MQIQKGYLSIGYKRLKKISDTFVAALPEIEAYGMVEVQTVEEDQQNNGFDVFEDLAAYRVESPADVGQSIDGFKSLLGVVDSTWSTIKNIFSSSKKTAIVEKITNLGFSQLQSTCFIRSFKGVPQDQFEAVKRTIISTTEVPADKLGAFNDWWNLAQVTAG
jgi:hypothetical protein